MKFTKYIWNLYNSTSKGMNLIKLFETINIKSLSEKYEFQYSFDIDEKLRNEDNVKTKTINIYDNTIEFAKNVKIHSTEDARSFFNNFVFIKRIPIQLKLNNGQTQTESYLSTEEDDNKYFFDYFASITAGLYNSFPEYFFPFLFERKDFHTFIRICENFDISIPVLPPKNNWTKRIWFYFDLCISLNEYRKHMNLNPSEFAAFIYGFGLNSLEPIKKEDLPNPLKVWFVGAGDWDYDFLDNANELSKAAWGAGNERIKRGDIIIMYCTAPRKEINSIWRATTDSFRNPFESYYYFVNIGFPNKISPIGYQTLATNPIIKKNSTIRARMQGLNGKPLNQTEYNELLRLINELGVDISNLPNLPDYHYNSENIQNERDVEIKLIEPILLRLAFKTNEWMRQMPIRMGRGIRYYPDYAIHFNIKRGEESAKIIIEAKFEILSEKQLEEAYLQAKSYAVRLQSNVFIVADKNSLYIFEPNRNSFEFNNRIQYLWSDLDNPDTFHSFKEKINNKALHPTTNIRHLADSTKYEYISNK